MRNTVLGSCRNSFIYFGEVFNDVQIYPSIVPYFSLCISIRFLDLIRIEGANAFVINILNAQASSKQQTSMTDNTTATAGSHADGMDGSLETGLHVNFTMRDDSSDTDFTLLNLKYIFLNRHTTHAAKEER